MCVLPKKGGGGKKIKTNIKCQIDFMLYKVNVFGYLTFKINTVSKTIAHNTAHFIRTVRLVYNRIMYTIHLFFCIVYKLYILYFSALLYTIWSF